uniref:Uncharacterized protein n=1 Tax=Anopheles atroparvus TaxID=41427 RepID=A0A182IMP9_ANOAO
MCEWFPDSGVTGVSCVIGVVWLACELCWCAAAAAAAAAAAVVDIVLICGERVRLRLSGVCRTLIVFSRCQTNTLCTIAPPQNTIPTPIRMLVTIAGVEWNWPGGIATPPPPPPPAPAPPIVPLPSVSPPSVDALCRMLLACPVPFPFPVTPFVEPIDDGVMNDDDSSRGGPPFMCFDAAAAAAAVLVELAVAAELAETVDTFSGGIGRPRPPPPAVLRIERFWPVVTGPYICLTDRTPSSTTIATVNAPRHVSVAGATACDRLCDCVYARLPLTAAADLRRCPKHRHHDTADDDDDHEAPSELVLSRARSMERPIYRGYRRAPPSCSIPSKYGSRSEGIFLAEDYCTILGSRPPPPKRTDERTLDHDEPQKTMKTCKVMRSSAKNRAPIVCRIVE